MRNGYPTGTGEPYEIHPADRFCIGCDRRVRDGRPGSGVEGGRLKKWVDTRWHTMYDCVESVIFHRVPLETVSF